MNIDNIIERQNKKEYNKEEYKAYKTEEKQKTYSLADETANKVFSSSKMLKTYLDVQATFPNYSVNNALLIAAQMPEAKMIKSLEEWKKLGAFAKPNCKFITILEPGQKYLKSDNSISTSFNTKKVLDISQTTIAFGSESKTYNSEEMLKAFLYKCTFNVKAADNTPSGKAAEYNKQENVIYIKRGAEATQIFNNLSYAFALAGLDSSGNLNIDNFVCNCASYLICKNMNITVNEQDLKIPDELKGLETIDMKSILTRIRSLMEDNTSRINDYYKNKDIKSKDHER